jgi:OOP family OmpA-OmpF porin
MRIEVHTDNMGGAESNQLLSEKRALEVAKALVAKGVDCKRVLPVGFGETKPKAENKTPEGKAQNRRTVFVHAALRGRAINSMPLEGGGKVAGDPCK